MKKEALRVSTTIPSAPTTVYLAWLSSEQHSAMTGAVAKIDANVGGKFTTSDGYISGKFVALDLGRRIVMSWRTTDFPRDAHDSKVEIQFEALGGSTRITILHTEIPEGQGEQYRTNWNDKYFTPIRNHFSKYLPDPRKPPPPRRPPPPPEEEEEEETPKVKGKPGKGAKAPPPVKAVPAKAAPAKAAPTKAAPTKAPPPSKAPASKAPASKAPASKAPASKAPASKAPASKAPAKAPAKSAPAKKPAKPAPKPTKPVAKKPAKPAPKKPAAKKKK